MGVKRCGQVFSRDWIFFSGFIRGWKLSRKLIYIAAVMVIGSRFAWAAPDYTFITVDCSALGLSGTVYGINNHNMAVSNFSLFDLSVNPYTCTGIPGGFTPQGINDSGQIVGISLDQTHDIHSIVYDHGTTTVLAAPSSIQTQAYGINNNGQVVGRYVDSSAIPIHGFFYDNGNWTTLNHPAATISTRAIGINGNGQIVGAYDDTHGFVYSGGVWTPLDYPGSLSTLPMGINDAGKIVGFYVDSNFFKHGFLYDNGTWTTLDFPGAITGIFGINNAGYIVGGYIKGGEHGFLAMPSTSISRNGLGQCPCTGEGNPINAAIGNKFQAEIDFVGAANTGLELRRYYNSQDTTATAFGANWHSTWHRGVKQASASLAAVTSADGRVDTFTKNSTGAWVSDPDVTSTLTAVMSGTTQTGWKLVTADDSAELYTLDGRLSSFTDRAGNITTLNYDASNRLNSVTGPFGHKLAFSYNANNLISGVTLPDGGVLSYGYDAANNLISVRYADNTIRQYVYNEPGNTTNANLPNALTGIVDENGARFATWKYDTQGRAVSSEHANGEEKVSVVYNADGTTSVTDANGNVHGYNFITQFSLVKPTAITGAPVPNAGGKSVAYDANGFVASRTDFNGNVTTYVHDSRGLETSRTEAAGTAQARTITTQWHSIFHLPVKITEPSGVSGVNRVTTFTYDATGNLITKTITAGSQTRSWAYTYNSHGQVLTIDGPRIDVTDKTSFSYDTAGNLAAVTNALGQGTKITSYDADGRPLTLQDPNGLLTKLTYNARGQITSRIVGQELTSYAYDPVAQLTKITLPDDSFLAYSYNDAHQLTRIADALGNHIDYTLDLAGNIIEEQVFDPNNALVRTRSHAYDAVNRLAQDIGALDQTILYNRDANGNVVGITDPNNFKTVSSFDALNRLAASVDPNNGTTKIDHNPDDSVAKVTDPKGVATLYGYDGLGNQISVQSKDSGTTTRTFDTAGNVKTSTDARGFTTTNTYDALNRLIKQVFGKKLSITYAYDQGVNGIGHLTTMTDPSGSTIWTYDQRGHVLTKKQKVGKITLTTTNTYDTVTGQLSSTTLPSGQVIRYHYDANGKPESILAGTTPIVSTITYQPFGPAQRWIQGGGATNYQRQFDLDGNLSDIDFGNTAASAGQETIVLSRDLGSRITEIQDNTVLAKTFGYDALDELISYAGAGVAQDYNYDANGNRTQFISNANTANYSIDPASNRLLSRSVGTTMTNYALDAAGNLTSDGTRSFTIDARGKLASVKVGKTTTSYAYNGFGERVQKNTTLFTQDANGNITGEYDSKGKAIQETIYLGNLPIAILRPGTTYFVNPDHLGAPRTITTTAGAPVWSWDRDPFGNGQPVASGSFVNNLRFPGQYYDSETGLHYNNARYYDPIIGRYIQSDPIGLVGGINTFAYVENNPVNFIDPSGLSKYDPFYGLPKTFWNWFHRAENGKLIQSLKDECGHVPKDVAQDYYKEWLDEIKGKNGFIDPAAIITLVLPPIFDALTPSPLGGCDASGICTDSMNQSYPSVPLPVRSRPNVPFGPFPPQKGMPLQSFPPMQTTI